MSKLMLLHVDARIDLFLGLSNRIEELMLYKIVAIPKNVHWGYFDASLSPVQIVKDGDIIMMEAITHHAGDAPNLMMDKGIEKIFTDIPIEDRNPGVHIMTGPLYVQGAKPGDMLEVEFLAMDVRNPYGSNYAAPWGYLYEETDKSERVTIYRADTTNMFVRAVYAYDYPDEYSYPGKIVNDACCCHEAACEGIAVTMAPHLGTAGVAPDLPGRISTIPPGAHGGNIDNWRIGAGAKMFYPVFVDGALFSIGDPHISQGDGELNGTAIEASLDVVIRVKVRRDFYFPTPLLETSNEWLVHGFDIDLNAAMRNTAVDTLRFLTEIKKLSRNDAYSIASIACNFGITQVVDDRKGVHSIIPKAMFRPDIIKFV